jgi:hypothetical protein
VIADVYFIPVLETWFFEPGQRKLALPYSEQRGVMENWRNG